MSELGPITLKRIAGDLRKFYKEKPAHFKIFYNKNKPLEINFILYGLKDSPYAGGEYLGKLVHSPVYPAKPPDYYFSTPNGRFHLNSKICITTSGYHLEEWAPAAWNLLTLLEGLLSVWHSDVSSDKHGIGHLNTPVDKIKKLAENSVNFNITNFSDLVSKIKKIEV